MSSVPLGSLMKSNYNLLEVAQTSVDIFSFILNRGVGLWLMDPLAACQVNKVELRRAHRVCCMVFDFDRDRHDAVWSRGGVVHRCWRHTADVVSHHKEVHGGLFIVALMDRQVTKMQILREILKQSYFAPLFKWNLRVLSIKKIIAIFIVDFKVLHISIELKVCVFRFVLFDLFENWVECPRNDASGVPRLATTHWVCLPRPSLSVCKYRSVISLETVVNKRFCNYFEKVLLTCFRAENLRKFETMVFFLVIYSVILICIFRYRQIKCVCLQIKVVMYHGLFCLCLWLEPCECLNLCFDHIIWI